MPTKMDKGPAFDNWDKDLHPNHSCATCHSYNNFRCRRHAPSGQEGWPAVFPTDWCQDHKMSKNQMLAILKGGD
jgi:hypothetical protein